MRELLTYIFVFSCMIVFGQQDDLSDIVNEIDVSVNRTLSTRHSEYSEQFGFGVGAKHIFMKSKKLNLVTGMEYNLNRFQIDHLYDGHWSYLTDVRHTLHNLSIPLYVRWNFGKKINFFVEAGGFIDLIIDGKRSGTRHTASSNLTGEAVSDFEDEGAVYSTISYGASMGFGVSFPLEGCRIFIKPDCKLGLVDLNYYPPSVINSSLRINLGIQL